MPRIVSGTHRSHTSVEERMRMPYPEMTMYFVRRFNPRKETILGFMMKAYPSHYKFLSKRDWSEAKIRSLWHGITKSLINKREVIRKTERKYHMMQRHGHWRVVDRYRQ